eukprot:4193006-Amphidinium_carterae.1
MLLTVTQRWQSPRGMCGDGSRWQQLGLPRAPLWSTDPMVLLMCVCEMQWHVVVVAERGEGEAAV